MSLTPLIHNFLETLGKLGYARTTLSGYAQDLHAFERHVVRCGDLRITDITLRIVDAFLDGQDPDGKPPCPATRNRRLSCLRSFFRYLIEQGELPNDQDPTRRVRFARLAQRGTQFFVLRRICPDDSGRAQHLPRLDKATGLGHPGPFIQQRHSLDGVGVVERGAGGCAGGASFGLAAQGRPSQRHPDQPNHALGASRLAGSASKQSSSRPSPVCQSPPAASFSAHRGTDCQ